MALDQFFSLRILPVLGTACLIAAASCGQARADAASAQACAAKLPPEAKAIYDRNAPSVKPTTDLGPLLKSTVPGMVFEGDVKATTARSSAMAAVPRAPQRNIVRARAKKSSPPKLPDLRARRSPA
jgi:hypothetical protein